MTEVSEITALDLAVTRASAVPPERSPAGGLGPAGPTPLRVMPLHYPGDGLHLLSHPGRRTLSLSTPEAAGQQFCCWETHTTPGRGGSRGTSHHVVHDHLAASWLSLGAVMLYADMFVTELTDLGSLAQVFEDTYPATPPPIPLRSRFLIAGFASHIYPIVPDTRKRSRGLWSDLAVHGLGRLAETLALAAQEHAYRSDTGRAPPPAHRRTLIELVRATTLQSRRRDGPTNRAEGFEPLSSEAPQ